MDITAIVKTFKRDAYLRECLSSLKATYPTISIIVVDDCGDEHNRPLVESVGGLFLTMPFDSGLPAGRNLALQHVKTSHVLIGDDDFFHDTSDALQLLKLMDVADIAGGRVVEHGSVRNYQGTFSEDGRALVWNSLPHQATDVHDGILFSRCHLVFNYFVAKTDCILRMGGWDENIKVAYEHSDFFIKAWKEGVKVVWCPTALVTHKPEHVVVSQEELDEYAAFRVRKSDREYFLAKWGYEAYRDMGGHVERPKLTIQQLKMKKAFIVALSALDSTRAKFWLEAGTCLGAVRENNFIRHDNDIDFGVFGDEYADDIDKAMRAMGFTLYKEFGTKGNGLERSYFSPEGVKVDVFFFYETGDVWWHSAWQSSLDGKEFTQLYFDFPKHLFQRLQGIEFMGQHNVPLPNPPGEYLTCRYGDWQTPKKEWDWANDPLCRRKK